MFFSVIEEVCAILPEISLMGHNKQHLRKYLSGSFSLFLVSFPKLLNSLILVEAIVVVGCSE